MKVGVEIYNNKDEYIDGQFCTEYSFDCTNNESDFEGFLDLMCVSLKQDKYIVLYRLENGNG